MSDSDSDGENVIKYGTPLEPYEEDEIPSKRKYQQPADQYAVDANGRRRFHGAFTGGFSAGYGNSVGTPEGWAPVTFKSSRGEKAQVSSQRPEDFMDEEDRSEFGIAPRHMQTHSEFSGQKRTLQKRYHDGPIPGEPVLEELIKAVHETAAVRMLRAMGWRPGQGTGDRVSRAEKRKGKERHKVYGCYMPEGVRENTQQSSEDSDSDYDIDTLFAPDDYDPYILQRKDDRFGLGYSGLSRHSVLGNMMGEYGAGSSKSHLLIKDKGKKVSIRGQAFGVGAFEADDEDIYGTEDMSHYDFELGAPSGDKKRKPVKQGANVLEGFVKATKPPPPVPSHPPPALPRDFTPAPAGARRTRFEPTDKPQRDQGLGRHDLTAEARGALLGEAPPTIPTIPPPQPPDPIAKLLGRNVNFVNTEQEKTTEANTEENFIPITASDKQVTKVFRPFMSNPKKQSRYELFVRDRESYFREGVGEDRLSEWEKEREIVEFEQAAKLYRPLTGVMNDRFTHASEPDDSTNPLTVVTKSTTNYGLASKEMVEAASRGVYGVMTRREAPWRPDSLVSKRFNVPEIGGSRTEQKKEDKPKVSYSIFSYLESSVHDKDSFAKEQTQFSGSKSIHVEPKNQLKNPENRQLENVANVEKIKPIASSSNIEAGFNKRMTVADLFMKESEKDMTNKGKGEEVTETIEKFDKMDLYKSIFLSDSEDDDVVNQSAEKDPNDFIDKPKNVERNMSPPRGIFANIDFDELNSWRRKVDDKKPKESDTVKDPASVATVEKNVASVENKANKVETYGPKIPENIQKRLESQEITENFRPMFRSKSEKVKETIEIDSSSSEDSWVEVKETKSKKQKKKKSKKHKSKHKKSKHKKKGK